MTAAGLWTQRWGWQPTARILGGLPTWAWRCAPAGLLTRRQMRAAGLAPGGAEPVAQVICKRGRRRAYLYDPADLVPKRIPSSAQLEAAAKATKARRWCPTCQRHADYCIPTSLGECVECHHCEAPAGHDTAAGAGADTTAGRVDEDTADTEWRTETLGLIERELRGRPVDDPAHVEPAAAGAGRCQDAVGRAEVALGRLHEQPRTERERWAPPRGGGDPVAGCSADDRADDRAERAAVRVAGAVA